MCLVSLNGCAEGQGLPTATGQFVGIQPSPAIDTPLPVTITATGTSLPTPSLEPTYVRIKNARYGTYLYEADHQVRHGNPGSADVTSHWIIEDYQGSKRIRNRSSGHYMSIEHLREYVEIIPIEPVWMSPRWTFEAVPSTGATVIRNVWHNWEVLYTDETSDVLRYGRALAEDDAAQWILETVGGGALPGSTATPVVLVPTPAQPLESRGAMVPWIEYEAEDGQTNGEILGPDRTFGTIAAESSGRRSVQLDAAGEYVQFTASQAANSIVVRYVIPDAPDGGGITATLSLYIDGRFRQKLTLTSRYAWSYGGEEYTYNKPAMGGAHHFFDEARALVGDIPAGATVRLQKDADDTAEYYVVDLVDLEPVGPPKDMPVGFLSITTDCGAAPDDGNDDGPAIQRCVDMAQMQGKGVWIPAGTFESTTAPINVADVTIRGAGMWYSIIHGFYARFNCTGNNCRYSDFAILGETVTRDDKSPENGFNGGAGTGSRLDNIWVEHTKVGYWVGPGGTNGLVISNSRFRNLFADGVNFCEGASNSMVENSHFRNTGDDALASWSPAYAGGVNTNNVFRFNTVQVPWRANCFAIYGGRDNAIENNLCYDVVTYPGILIAQDFNSHPFAGTTRILRNSLIRAGGQMFRQEHGALKIRAAQGDIGQVIVRDMWIDSPTYSGIEIEGSHGVGGAISDVQIVNPGTWGILIRSNAAGRVAFTNVTISNPGAGRLLNYGPPAHFTLVEGPGNDW